MSVPCLLGPAPLTIRVFKTLQSDPRDLWPLRHLIRVMRRHDLTKKYLPTYIPTHLPTYLPTYVPPLENTLKERSERLVTYETFDQSDEKTWPDQKIPTYLHTYPLTYLPTYLCTSIREQPIGAIIGTCDIWDTDYNTDNWEPGFMTIFVTWQLIVTLDSIRNTCDVC